MGRRGGPPWYVLPPPLTTVRLPGDRIAPTARSWALRQVLAVKQALKGQQQGYNDGGQGRHARPLVLIWSSLPCSYNLSSFCTKSRFQPRQWNISVGQPQHEVRRFGHVSNFCTKSSLRPEQSRSQAVYCPRSTYTAVRVGKPNLLGTAGFRFACLRDQEHPLGTSSRCAVAIQSFSLSRGSLLAESTYGSAPKST